MKGKRNIQRVDSDMICDQYVKEFDYTPFQQRAIETVYKLRSVRFNQITRILGYSNNYARANLRELYYCRFLDRRFPYEEKSENGDKGSVQGIYMLDEAGKIFMAGYSDVELKDVNWIPRDNLIEYRKMKHTLQCAEIAATVFEECRHAKYQVMDYRGERFLWTAFKYQNAHYEFSPDLYIKVLKDKSTYRFLFENDEATMDIRSFLAKVPKYDNYKLSGQYIYTYDAFPRVLVITTSKERAITLAEEVGKRQKSKVDFLFTWHDAFFERPFGSTTFIHTSVKQYPRTYSMFDEIPEECRVGLHDEADAKEVI